MTTRILTELCSVPTAPFAEQHVIEYVERFVKARPKLRLYRDRFSNLLIELPGRQAGRKTAARRLVFVAHMDHPGMVARRMIGRTTLLADFYGCVEHDYVRGAKVRFFDGKREVPGTVVSTTEDRERSIFPGSVTVRVRSNVSAGTVGMFDQGPGRIKNGKFYSRACDDVGGAASALALLDELLRRPVNATVAVLLTRAEEDAFIGAIAAVLYPKLLKKSDLVISIECSAMQPYARQGNGVVLRVGDRTSVFNSAFMYFLQQTALGLTKRDKGFKFQRSLMPGGTCEATVFDAYGYTTGAVCVPLGNYHNMDRDRKKIGPEYVDVSDWTNMVKLFVEVAKQIETFKSDLKPLKQKIERRFRMREKLLLKSR